MSEEDWAYLAARSDADFPNGLFRTYFRPSLNAVGRTALDVAYLVSQAQAYADIAAASLAAMQALGASTTGIGTASLSLPRAGDLGSGAFRDWQYSHGVITNLQNAAYQMTLHDYGKLLLTTSGTNTWTLPLGTDLPEAWWCFYMNIAGANLTFARTGGDTVNAAATSVVIASGAAIGLVLRRSATTFLIG